MNTPNFICPTCLSPLVFVEHRGNEMIFECKTCSKKNKKPLAERVIDGLKKKGYDVGLNMIEDIREALKNVVEMPEECPQEIMDGAFEVYSILWWDGLGESWREYRQKQLEGQK